MLLDEDEVTFMIEHTTEMDNFLVSVITKKTVTPEQFADCLIGLAVDIRDYKENYFKASHPINDELQ